MDAPDSPRPAGLPSTPPPAPPLAPAPALAPREIERALSDQRYLLHLVMGVVIVLLVTTTLALFHQIRWLVSQAGQLNTTAIELTKAVNEYETNTVPQLNRLFTDCQRFAQTDPDFAKIMARYRLAQEGGATNSPAATPPSPGPSP